MTPETFAWTCVFVEAVVLMIDTRIICRLWRERDAARAEAALRAKCKPEEWNCTNALRARLYALCQRAGVNPEGKWLSEAACEAIDTLSRRAEKSSVPWYEWRQADAVARLRAAEPRREK